MPLLVRLDTNEESTSESPVPCRPVSWNRSSSVEGADDVGDDLEIGNLNHADLGTEFTLDLPDAAFSYGDDAVLFVRPASEISTGIPVDGIKATGTAGGSALVGTALIGGGAAIIGRASSSTNPGVLGTNDMGIGVSGISSSALSGIGVSGSCNNGTGVFGGSSTGSGVVGNSDSSAGVFGFGASGSGVYGTSPTGTGVIGESALTGRGGVFVSGSGLTPWKTTKGGIAQLRLVPSADANLPTKAAMGDLYAHRSKTVNLYLCVNDAPVQWRQVQLGTTYAGGQMAP
jgi:hypothetical protein